MAKRSTLKKVVRENPTTSTIAVLAVGGVAAIGLTWWLVERNAAAAAPALSQAATPQNVVPLQPGATTIAPAKGSTVTLQLPAGANLQSVTADGTPFAGTFASNVFTFVASDDAQIVATWTPASGGAQVMTINVVPPGS